MRAVLASRSVWLASFVAWTLTGVFLLGRELIRVGAGTRGPVGWLEVAAEFESLWLWALITPVIVGAAAALTLERGLRARSLALHGLFAATLCVLDVAIDALVLPRGTLGTSPFFDRVLQQAFVNTFSYVAVAGIGYAFLYDRALARDRQRAAELERRFAEARLEALTSKLRPHFLFNALNSIAALIRLGEHEAALSALVALGDLLRAVVSVSGDARVPLEQELEWSERYLALERIRFQDCLQTSVRVEKAAEGALVPALVLQPIVENAIRHGIQRRRGAGSVSIEAARVGDFLSLVVRDSGEAREPCGQAPGLGIGLESTRERLDHLYGPSAYGLELVPSTTGSTAQIRIPYSQDTA